MRFGHWRDSPRQRSRLPWPVAGESDNRRLVPMALAVQAASRLCCSKGRSRSRLTGEPLGSGEFRHFDPERGVEVRWPEDYAGHYLAAGVQPAAGFADFVQRAHRRLRQDRGQDAAITRLAGCASRPSAFRRSGLASAAMPPDPGEAAVQTNRNRAIGDYSAFAPRRKTIEEIVAEARDPDHKDSGRTSVGVLDMGAFSLVRYRIGSGEWRRDLEALGVTNRTLGSEYPGMVAVFGIVDRASDRALAVIETLEERRGRGPLVCSCFAREGDHPPRGAVLEALAHLDVPPSRRNGEDSEIAARFDAWYEPGRGGWAIKPPLHAVAVTFRRSCFGTRPALHESVDVLVPADPALDIRDPAEDAAYRAKEHYRRAAWGAFQDRFDESGAGIRPGFSSWGPVGEPRSVKVVDPDLYGEMSTPEAERGRDAGQHDENGPFPSP